MNNKAQEAKQVLLDDLKKLSKGAMSPQNFQAKYSQINTKKTTKGMVPNIMKVMAVYLDDEISREEDPAFRKMQDDELEKLITLIENNASPIHIKNIDFIDVSKPLTAEDLARFKKSNVLFVFKAALIIAAVIGAGELLEWILKV